MRTRITRVTAITAAPGLSAKKGERFNLSVRLCAGRSRPPVLGVIVASSAALAFAAAASAAGISSSQTATQKTAQPIGSRAHHAIHYRYTAIDLGTLGGPQADIAGDPLNPQGGNGAVIGAADTSVADPFGPNDNPMFGGDTYVQHAFIWRDGVLHDLGALGAQPSKNSSYPNVVNARGDAAGLSDTGTIDPLLGYAEADAVLWKDGRIINLGTLGGYESFAASLNNRDQVAGVAANAIADPLSMFGWGTQTRAFLWQDGAMRDLGTLGGPDAAAFLVNNRGQVAGASYTNAIVNPVTGTPTTDPFLWEDGHMRDLGTLGGTQGGVGDMNNRGEVVGQSNLTGDQTAHPFLWKDGSLIDLGTLGGSFGTAISLNEAGQVVGDANIPGDKAGHAFLWKNGAMTDLGTVKGDGCSFAVAINARSQVVGGSGSCGSEPSDGFLWEHGTMTDLNTLVAPSGTHLGYAFSINDRGEIVALGGTRGNQHEFLLVPND